MIGDKPLVAIIPARSGSKRLPNKNILPLNGRPMVEWTIMAAKNSRYIDDVIVTTDSDKIGEVALDNGVKYLKRPSHLAKDKSASAEVVLHALCTNNINTGFFIFLQPTSPLRTSQHIDEACKVLISKNADAVVSVCKMSHPPQWANTIPSDGCMSNFIRPDYVGLRSQDLPQHYRLSGAIYLSKIEQFKNEGTFILPTNTYSYIMPSKVSVDIDDEMDFKFAKFLFDQNETGIKEDS